MAVSKKRRPTVEEATNAQLACDLAESLDRLDLMVFQYPRELKCAGDLRKQIARAIVELKDHADAH